MMNKNYSPQIFKPDLKTVVTDLNIDQVRDHGEEPFQHPAGFIRVELDTPHQSRLNIWPASVRLIQSNIHDHIYSYHSRVICGQLSNIPYIYGWNQRFGTHELVEANANSRDEAIFRRSNLFFQVYQRSSKIIHPGEEYKFSAFLPHQISHQQLTATISYKTAINPDKKPIILVPRNEAINPTAIPRLTQTQIWELIAEVIDQAKFSLTNEPYPKLH